MVISDTHLKAGSPRRLPVAALRLIEGADVLLHAGDIVDRGTLRTLEAMAPTFAVLGNNDRTLVDMLPITRSLDLAGVPVAMVHDSGATAGRAARLWRRFPDAAVVVFGHSHAPMDVVGQGTQRLFNPGSPTQRRSQPHHTVGILDLDGGQVVAHRIEVVD